MSLRRKWREIFAWGPCSHPVKDFVVDLDFYKGLVKSFQILKDSHKYLPPVSALHPEIMSELTGIAELRGANYGMIGGLRMTESGIEAGFLLNKLGVIVDDLGAIGYLSPSFYNEWLDPHTGEKLGPVLREVSLVDVPHQKNISSEVGQIYGLSDAVSLAESGFNNIVTGEIMDEEIEKEEVDAAEEPATTGFTEADRTMLQEVHAAVTAKGDIVAEEIDPEGMDLSEQVSQLRNELKVERAQSKVRADLGAVATDELVRSLAPMSLSDAAGYKSVVAGLKAHPAGRQTQAPAGNAGVSNAGPISLSEKHVVNLAEKAASAGVKRGLPLIKYLTSQGLDREQVVTACADHGDAIKRIYSALGA